MHLEWATAAAAAVCAGLATAAPVGIAAPAPQESGWVVVKFRDGLGFTAREGRLVVPQGVDASRRSAVAQAVPAAAEWRRSGRLSDERIRELTERAEQRLGKDLPDLTQVLRVRVPEGVPRAEFVDRLLGLEEVESALPAPVPTLPAPGNFEEYQLYAGPAPQGVGVWPLHDVPGGRGEHVRVLDIEFTVEPHNDLPSITVVGGPWVDPSPPGWHGTAVIGVMGSLDDGIGTTGGVPDAEYLFIGTYNGSWYDIEGAILLAADTLEAGDVVLIEQQIGGPRTTGNGQEGYVSVSWWPWAFVAIEIAVGNGICVVEAAGNGSQNLSHPAYTTGNWGHHPYVPENDHLGITVGASGSAWDRDRIRASFSNYGPTVDLHGWGWDVLAPGYGDAYSEPGWRYTWFSGTSSATPVVANAVAAIQSIHKAVRGVPMDPVELRDVLIATGSPQLSENGQHIGPRPDAEAALWAIFGAEDCDGNGRPDEIDFAAGGDANGNGTLDACEPPCPADFDGSGTADIGDLLAFLGAFRLGRGDFDGNGSSDVNDLLAFLGAFRAGC